MIVRLFIEVIEGGRFDFVAAFNRYYLTPGLAAPDYTDGPFFVHYVVHVPTASLTNVA